MIAPTPDTGAKGRILGMSIGAAGNYSYAYDAYGRLNTIATSAGNFGYTPLANSELPGTLTRPNNVNTAWSYETHRDLVTGVANGTLSMYSYVNDALGRRQSMAKSGSLFNPTETLSYAYNDRSEVTGASSDVNQNYSYFYAFDPIGNRTNANLAGTAVSYTANILNQYIAVNTDNPTYDDDGNMLTNGAWVYTWNGENRLITAVNGTQRVEFAYDYMGRRIYKKVYSGETLTKYLKFVYDGYKLVEELDGLNSDALFHRYVWQPDAVGLNVPVSMYDTATDKTYFYHADANKNVTEMTDNTGAVVDRYGYSPFGIQTVATGTFVNENPIRFSSEYYDAETGLVYYIHRYYSPLLGRWTKKDPIGEVGGVNLYGMAGNNVIDTVDFLGLYSYTINSDGTDTVSVENCEIVIFDGHGNDTKPHKFIFPKNSQCSMAGFSGCYSDITNNKIDSSHLIPGAPKEHTDISTNSPEKKEQKEKLASGALTYAQVFCKKCCKNVKISIHSNMGRGWAILREGNRTAEYNYNCDTKTLTKNDKVGNSNFYNKELGYTP